ncbi:hypothetical protein B1748_17440 [Paenibacillus sp. MY03]|nr:hypothetical protein B1748_17440 [Paenibacillus sp. MY03]
MQAFYVRHEFKTIEEIKDNLITNYNQLVEEYSNYTEEKLFEYTQSYWGVRYSRFEWLLQMLGHIYHHRGQLHTYILIDSKGIEVQLFE